MLLRHIAHPEEFKLLCDGLLRAELAGCVTTFGGKGRDGGIDARFSGAIGGVDGLWIFQYKFVETADPDRARSRLLAKFRRTKSRISEFEKVQRYKPSGYVVMTNADLTVAAVNVLEELASRFLPGTRLHVWDSSALNAMLRGREYVAQAASGARHSAAREVARDALRWLSAVQTNLLKGPALWPAAMEFVAVSRPGESIERPTEVRSEWQLDLDNSILALVDSPAYGYAAEVAFTRAFSFLDAVVTALGAVHGPTRDHVLDVSRGLRARDAAFSRRSADFRLEPLPIAFSVIEAAWGTGSSGLTFEDVSGGSGVVRRNHTLVYSGPAVAEVKEALTLLLREARAHPIRDQVVTARQRVLEQLDLAFDALWYPAELGLDAPAAWNPGLRPRRWAGFGAPTGQ